MREFNLKAAQAGEPIFVNMGSPFRLPDNGMPEWEQHRFVGLKANGDVVSESSDRAINLWTRPQEHVRMGPKKLTLYLELTFIDGAFYSCWTSQRQQLKRPDADGRAYRYATIEVDAP